jgi:hypothetical protein
MGQRSRSFPVVWSSMPCTKLAASAPSRTRRRSRLGCRSMRECWPTDQRLAIIKWDVFRPRLETWIAIPEICAASVELKKLATGTLVLEFADGSVIRREATRRPQLTAFAAAVEALVASTPSRGSAPGAPTLGSEPVGLYGWTMPSSS